MLSSPSSQRVAPAASDASSILTIAPGESPPPGVPYRTLSQNEIDAARRAADDVRAEELLAARFDLNADGDVSVDELRSFDADPAQTRGARLAILLGAERRVIEASPALRTHQQTLARSLVRAGGSGDATDVDAVVPTLMRLPLRVLEAMNRAHISVVVCRTAVTDYLPALLGEIPRGHTADDVPAGSSAGFRKLAALGWDHIAGTLYGSEVVIATIDAGGVDKARAGQRTIPPMWYGHGSYNALFHEIGHALNRHYGAFDSAIASSAAASVAADDANTLSARSQELSEARRADWSHLLPYYQQGGEAAGAGADEAFAESFARYYGGDKTLQTQWPALNAFWDSDPLTPASVRVALARREASSTPKTISETASTTRSVDNSCSDRRCYTVPWHNPKLDADLLASVGADE